MKSKAIFLDKDGTLIPDIPYNINISLISFSEHAVKALHVFQDLGYKLIIISNQSGLARGYFTRDEFDKVIGKIKLMGNAEGIHFNGFYYCPHHPLGIVPEYAVECSCRKPLPGLLLQAAEEMNLDLESSWMIGDILNDVEAGRKAGCRTILIDNGNESEWQMGQMREPDYMAKNLAEAALYISNVTNDHKG